MMAESVSMMAASGVGSMVRLQVRLTQDLADGLRQAATDEGVSQSEIIRRSLRDRLGLPRERSDTEIKRRALSIVGAFRGGPLDLARRHDHYFAEAIEAKWKAGE